MLNISVTASLSLARRREAVSADEKEDRGGMGEGEEEESEGKADKDGEEEADERSMGATQARKVKLSVVVSESSWMYVMPNLFRVVCEKPGWSLEKDENFKGSVWIFFPRTYTETEK